MPILRKKRKGRMMCIFGSHTICSQEAGLARSKHRSRNYLIRRWSKIGRNALNLWDMVIDTLQPPTRRDPMRNKKTKSVLSDERLTDSNNVPPNSHISSQRASLFVFEDNDAVIKLVIKGWSPFMRHISRTRCVNLDCLLDQRNLDP